MRFGHDTQYLHACRENFLIEVGETRHAQARHRAEHQLLHERADRSVTAITIVDGVSKPGDYVELVAEMDVLCVISNCPQINNPCNGFNPTPIRVLILEARED